MKYPKYIKLYNEYYAVIGLSKPCSLRCSSLCKGKGRALILKLIKTSEVSQYRVENVRVENVRVCWTNSSRIKPVSEEEVFLKLL